MKNLINSTTSGVNLTGATTSEERYRQLEKLSMDEVLGKTELPIPDEVLKARKEKELTNSQNTTPPMGLNTESFLLPSKNLLYGEDFDGHFNLRMFTTREERIRLSSTASFLETMVSILNGCISTTNGVVIDTKALTEFDFIYVMYKARIISYGASYPIIVECPHCGKTYRHIANLDELKVHYLPEDFKEPFEIGPLPRSGDILQMRFLRIDDRIKIEKEAKEILTQNPDYQGDPTYNGNLEKRIVTVNGKELSDFRIKEYVDNLSALDNQFIQYQLNKKNIAGLEIVKNIDCQYCNKSFPVSFSINSTFFRPSFDD